MSKLLKKYQASGNVLLWSDFRNGSIKDIIANTSPGIQGTTVKWMNTKEGMSVFTPTLSAAYSGLNYSPQTNTKGTILCYFKKTQDGTSIIQETIQNNQSYQFLFYNNAYGIWSYAGTTGFKTSGYTPDSNSHFYSTVFESVGITNFYVDAIYKGTTSTWTAGATGAALTVGYGADLNRQAGGGILMFAILNVKLTSEEVKQVYEEITTANIGIGNLKYNNFRLPTIQENDPLCVLHFDMKTKDGSNKLIDLKKPTRALTAGGIASPVFENTNNLGGVKFNSGYLYYATNNSDLWQAESRTVSVIIKPTHLTGGKIIVGSSGTAFYVGQTENKLLISFINASSVTRNMAGTTVLAINSTYVVDYVFEKSNLDITTTTYINGVLDRSLAYPGEGILASTTPLIIGSSNTVSANPFIGSIYDVKYYRKALSSTEIANKYLAFAKQPLLKINSKQMIQSLTTSTAGQQITNTPFIVSSGSFKLSNDGNKSWIECVTAGIAYMKSDLNCGTFMFEMYKGGASTTPFVGFMASEIGANNATNQNAWWLGAEVNERYNLVRSLAGAAGNKMYTDASYISLSTPYKMLVTVDPARNFTIYIKGGSITNWIKSPTVINTNPVLDTNVATSKYIILSLGIGDKVTNLTWLQGVIDPTTNYQAINF